jgi:hypothetical protein
MEQDERAAVAPTMLRQDLHEACSFPIGEASDRPPWSAHILDSVAGMSTIGADLGGVIPSARTSR